MYLNLQLRWIAALLTQCTYHAIQNEILQLFGNAIIREIVADCQKSHSFAVIVDGTQDKNRTEQESICLRYVNDNLQSCEQFVGFYAVDETTAAALSQGCQGRPAAFSSAGG